MRTRSGERVASRERIDCEARDMQIERFLCVCVEWFIDGEINIEQWDDGAKRVAQVVDLICVELNFDVGET